MDEASKAKEKIRRMEERKRLKEKIIELERSLAEKQDEIRDLKEQLGDFDTESKEK